MTILNALLSLMALANVGPLAEVNDLSEFCASVSERGASLDYKFTMEQEGSPKITGSGSVSFKDRSYNLVSGTTRVWCDGTEVWTVDDDSQEAYVETVDDSTFDLAANPALVLGSIDTAFNLEQVKADNYILTPIDKCTGFEKLELRMSGNIPVSIKAYTDKGAVLNVVISGFRFLPEDVAPAVFDPASLGADFEIIDLR